MSKAKTAASSKKKSKTKRPGKAAKKPPPKAKAPQKKEEKGRAAAAKTPARGAAPPTKLAPTRPAGASGAVGPGASPKQASPKPGSGKKGSRKSGLTQRRGPDGQLLAVGEVLLPGGPQGAEEMSYLLRGTVAAEHPAGDAGVSEIMAKRTSADPDSERAELTRHMHALAQRFESGTIEGLLPSRPQTPRRTFQTVVERAKLRRREIGAFLRGLDIGRTESSHMDSHGEASLQTLMEWAARLENLAEADEPDQADYAQFHRGLDQLENTTEALIVDVEATLRRLRDRVRSS